MFIFCIKIRASLIATKWSNNILNTVQLHKINTWAKKKIFTTYRVGEGQRDEMDLADKK